METANPTGQAQSTLFRAGDGGYRTCRIPALVVSPGGAVLAFAEARRYTGADDDEINLVLRRSLDHGQTWHDLQVLFADGSHSVNQPTPIVDHQTGRVVLVFCRDNRQVFAADSDDDGRTWSEPREITRSVADPGWCWLGAGPGHGLQLRSGRLLVPAWGDLTPGAMAGRPEAQVVQFSYAFFSDDHGQTWERGEPMDLDQSDECMAVETADGSLYMDMRSRRGAHCRAHAWSHDHGRTWSNVQHDPSLPEPSCQGSVVRLDERCVVMAHPASTDRRAHLTLYLSSDECRTWHQALVVDAGYSGYSDLTVTADGTLLCLYETDECQALTLVRLAVNGISVRLEKK